MFSVYNVIVQKPFTLDALAQAELASDRFYSDMTAEQRDFYLRAALEIGAREAARYKAQDVNALTRQLGAGVSEPEEVVGDREVGSGPYAEYDAEKRQITVHPAGLRYVAFLLHQDMPTIPDHALWNETTQNAVVQVARELLIAHELFHHLEATSLGPVHRTLPPMSISLLGRFWKVPRYVKRTREIAAHSFAFTLLGMNERIP